MKHKQEPALSTDVSVGETPEALRQLFTKLHPHIPIKAYDDLLESYRPVPIITPLELSKPKRKKQEGDEMYEKFPTQDIRFLLPGDALSLGTNKDFAEQFEFSLHWVDDSARSLHTRVAKNPSVFRNCLSIQRLPSKPVPGFGYAQPNKQVIFTAPSEKQGLSSFGASLRSEAKGNLDGKKKSHSRKSSTSSTGSASSKSIRNVDIPLSINGTIMEEQSSDVHKEKKKSKRSSGEKALKKAEKPSGDKRDKSKKSSSEKKADKSLEKKSSEKKKTTASTLPSVLSAVPVISAPAATSSASTSARKYPNSDASLYLDIDNQVFEPVFSLQHHSPKSLSPALNSQEHHLPIALSFRTKSHIDGVEQYTYSPLFILCDAIEQVDLTVNKSFRAAIPHTFPHPPLPVSASEPASPRALTPRGGSITHQPPIISAATRSSSLLLTPNGLLMPTSGTAPNKFSNAPYTPTTPHYTPFVTLAPMPVHSNNQNLPLEPSFAKLKNQVSAGKASTSASSSPTLSPSSSATNVQTVGNTNHGVLTMFSDAIQSVVTCKAQMKMGSPDQVPVNADSPSIGQLAIFKKKDNPKQ